MTHYETLCVSATCSTEELRLSYRQLILTHHPDKTTNQQQSRSTEIFQQIQQAYDVLSDTEKRRQYDQELLVLKQRSMQSEYFISNEIDLDDMYQLDAASADDGSSEENVSFAYDCRCGDCFVISTEQLEQGVDVVQCSSCTLVIKILYDSVVEEDE